MPTTFTNAAVATLSTLVTGVATTGLRNLANNTSRLGGEITPTIAAPELYSLPQLTAKFVSTFPVANATVLHCWFIEAKYNGATWEYPTIGESSDGSTTVFPAWSPDFIFTWDAGSLHAGAPDLMQSIPRVVARPAGRFKVLVRNVSGFATANANDTDTILKESTINELGT